MTKIYFVCGFIGSGKTTYSKALAEKYGAFRFSIDEWMIPLYGEHMEREVFDRRLATLQGLFKDSTMQLFSLGVPVISSRMIQKLRTKSEPKPKKVRYLKRKVKGTKYSG